MHKFQKMLIISVLTVIMAGVALLAYKLGKTSKNEAFARLDIGGTYISPWYNSKDGTFYFFLPSYADTAKIRIKTGKGQELSFNGVTIKDGDDISSLTAGETYTVSDKKNSKKYKAKLLKSANVAAIYVSTATGSMDSVYNSRDTKEVARITVADEQGNIVFDTAGAKIKGRGNSTWVDHDKKPFSVLLDEPLSILGMEKCSKWVLLANADDPSVIRNAVVFDTARAAGMPDVSEYRFADLYLNGEYNGVYMLCQSYDRFYERNGQDLEDLFLFSAELPERAGSITNMLRAADDEAILEVVIPKTLSDKDQQTASDIIKKLDDAILRGKGDITEIMDISSWVRKYLVDELFENYDSGLTSSYFHTYGGNTASKVVAGPVWDYDNCMGGTVNTKNPAIIYAGQQYRTKNERVLWYSELLSDDGFYSEVIKCYENEFIPLAKALVNGGIDEMAEKLAAAKKNDDIRWNTGTDNEYDHLKEYLGKRLEFLNSIWLENKEYCVVTYYDGGRDKDLGRFYIPKGSALSGFPEYIETMGQNTKWKIEDTGNAFDLNEKIDRDVVLIKTASAETAKKPGLLATLKESKLIICLASLAFMWILPIAFAVKKRYERGVS